MYTNNDNGHRPVHDGQVIRQPAMILETEDTVIPIGNDEDKGSKRTSRKDLLGTDVAKRCSQAAQKLFPDVKTSRAHFLVGQELGLDGKSFNDMIREEMPPTIPTLLAIEYKFGISKEWLLNGTGEMFVKRDTDQTFSKILQMMSVTDGLVTYLQKHGQHCKVIIKNIPQKDLSDQRLNKLFDHGKVGQKMVDYVEKILTTGEIPEKLLTMPELEEENFWNLPNRGQDSEYLSKLEHETKKVILSRMCRSVPILWAFESTQAPVLLVEEQESQQSLILSKTLRMIDLLVLQFYETSSIVEEADEYISKVIDQVTGKLNPAWVLQHLPDEVKLEFYNAQGDYDQLNELVESIDRPNLKSLLTSKKSIIERLKANSEVRPC
jgi:hypothetical protein